MTSQQRWWSVAGLGGLAVVALGAAWWAFSVDAEPVRVPVAASPQPIVQVAPAPAEGSEPGRRRRKARTEGRSAKAAKAERRKAREAREPRPRPEPRERVLEPEELMWARTEFREQRLTDMNERLERYAAAKGWSEELTEEVRIVMIDTIEGITDELLRVDAGEIEWPEMRADMRAFREDQARVVEELLGPEEFRGFAEQMGFARFGGDEPVEGRVRMRRRGRRAAQR